MILNEQIGIKPQVDKGVIKSLQTFLSKNLLQEEKELKEEAEQEGSKKSLLDESNIIEE